jgi:hypothetical protein
MEKMNKKAVSQLIATVLIILITVASVGIIIKITLDALNPKEFTITDNKGNEVDFVIKNSRLYIRSSNRFR